MMLIITILRKTVNKNEAGALMDKKEVVSGSNLNKSNNECESTHGRAVLRQLKKQAIEEASLKV